MNQNNLSVILPIYNGMPFLAEAIDSLIHQTYQDFVILAIDNGSTDGTRKYLAEMNNEKINYIRLEEKNLVKALNKGLELADTPLIARMDADDICHPKRFEKQINFLNKNSEIGLVGTNGRYISGAGNKYLNINLPLTHDKIIQTMLKKRNAIIHASIMFRSEITKLYGGYNVKYFPCEDYELFLRIGDRVKFSNIPERLYQFRIREGSIMSNYIGDSIKVYYYITKKYSSKYRTGEIINKLTVNHNLKLFEKFDVISVSIYRKGLDYFLNTNAALGLFFFIIASLINPVRFIGAIRKKIANIILQFY